MSTTDQKAILGICESLFTASIEIYKKLKSGFGLQLSDTTNESDDVQIGLDVFADDCFQKNLKLNQDVRFSISEEQPNFIEYNDGGYSVALDPLDGSKSALVGIPSGAIFAIFKDAKVISEFNGQNIVAGGFFVFGINLEVFYAVGDKAYKGTCDVENGTWEFGPIDPLPKAKMVAMNVSNRNKWEDWLSKYYEELVTQEDEKGKSFNMRWYASMVSEMKRLVLQGGLFAYPNDTRKGYDKGHLRLVYEAIPMAYLMNALGGSSTTGIHSILETEVTELHQKTPVFLGDAELIKEVERRGSLNAKA